MTEEAKSKQESQQATNEAWQEVGKQFQILGESLAAALRVSLNSFENRERVRAMQGGLEAMINNVDQAIEEAMASPQAQQARQEAQKAAESLRTAGEQTVQDVRPHLLNALKQVNEELHTLITRMDASSQRESPPPAQGDKQETA